MVLAIANDNQFKKFCIFAKLTNLYSDEKFKTNSSRVNNRTELNVILKKVFKTKTIRQWVDGLIKLNVPCGPINNIKQVFDDPQVKSRRMKISMNHRKMNNKKINLVGSPLNLSESPVKYKKTPPTLGEDTNKILKEFLKLNSSDLKRLKEKKII